jgi:hypothetical protein
MIRISAIHRRPRRTDDGRSDGRSDGRTESHTDDKSHDEGMSTAEYAVGTIAAAAFAGLLFKIVTSAQVQTLLTGIIKKALETAG